jgi:apolipoprotein N-acyltransferase
LIQGSIDTTFSEADESQLIFEQYASLTREALDQAAVPHQRRLAMIVWPESMFPFPWIDVTQPVQVPTDAVQDGATYRANVDQWRTGTIDQAAGYFGKLAVPAVVGAARLQFGPHPLQRYNSALYFNAQGKLVQSYDKMRPILFGEYLPFGKIFPWLYRLTPMAVGLDRGDTPVVFECEGVRFSPSICFENTIPHLLLTQFRALRARGQSPDVLLTLTNDGWFWGSSLLDTHLACGIFRAVELRRPVLIAANTGFSAWIDATGHVVRRGPRRDRGIVVADVQPHGGGESVYLLVGDFPAAACGMFCGILVLFRLRRWRK